MAAKDAMDIVFADQTNFTALIEIIFLPKKISGYTSERLIEHEGNLLKMLMNTVTNFGSTLPKNSQKIISRMYDAEHEPHLKVEKLLNYLQPGKIESNQMIGIYVRAQNCGLTIFAPKDEFNESGKPEHLILSTFEASLRNEIVYSNLSDIQVSKVVFAFFVFFLLLSFCFL